MHRLRADFNGLFGEILCLSHEDTCLDETGAPIQLKAGMMVTACEDDPNERGMPDVLIASGVVEPAPEWLQCAGSKWVLRIDADGVRHQSEIGNPAT